METEARAKPVQRSVRIRAIVLGAILLGVVVVVYQASPVTEWLGVFDAYVQQLGPSGPLIYGFATAVGVVIFLPVIPLAIGSGALFGFWLGGLVAVSGTTLGATVSFGLGRTLLRKQVEQRAEGRPSFTALDRAITRSGARIVFLTRLAPIFPFSIINLAYGLTGVRPRDYILATATGILPILLSVTYLGATAADVATAEEDRIRTVLQIIGAVVSVVVAVLLARFAQRAVREAGVEE